MVLNLKNGKLFQVSCPEGYIKKEYKFNLIKQICKTEKKISSRTCTDFEFENRRFNKQFLVWVLWELFKSEGFSVWCIFIGWYYQVSSFHRRGPCGSMFNLKIVMVCWFVVLININYLYLSNRKFNLSSQFVLVSEEATTSKSPQDWMEDLFCI